MGMVQCLIAFNVGISMRLANNKDGNQAIVRDSSFPLMITEVLL